MKLASDSAYVLAHCNEIPLKRSYWLGNLTAALEVGIENLPPPPFSLVIEASESDLNPGQFSDLFKNLIKGGLGYFISFGPKGEELHDRFDWDNLDVYGYEQPLTDQQHVMSIWTKNLEEALDDSELIGGLTMWDAEIHHVVVLLQAYEQ